MCTHSAASASGAIRRRRTAGEACAWARASRSTNKSLLCSAAALCRRRNCSGRAWGSQASTASMAAQRKACSLAHSASAGLALVAHSHSRRCAARPWACNAGANGRCGAATSATGPLPHCTSAGRSKRHSLCTPGSCKSSVKAPRGQPPPGSWASSKVSPVGTVGAGAAAKLAARQTSARKLSRGAAAASGRWGKADIEAQYTVFMYSILRLAQRVWRALEWPLGAGIRS